MKISRTFLTACLVLAASIGPSFACGRRYESEYGLPASGGPEVPERFRKDLEADIRDLVTNSNQNISSLPYDIPQMIVDLSGKNPPSPDRSYSKHSNQCTACRTLGKLVLGYIRKGGPVKPLMKILVKVCYMGFYRNTNVCRGILYKEKDALQYIVHHKDISADDICALALSSSGQDGSCGIYMGPSWSVKLPLLAPVRYKRRLKIGHSGLNDFGLSSPDKAFQGNPHGYGQFLRKTDPRLNKGKPYLKVLHLTDIHFDPSYKVGSSIVCEAPICCSRETGPAVHPEEAAGPWGNYGDCDSPRALVENMLSHIAHKHKDLDYIMWTGDSVPHDLWRISKRDNIAVLSDVAAMVHHFLPGIPVYSALGNHESFPRDSFPPPEDHHVWQKFGIQWLYDYVAYQWQTFITQPLPETVSKIASYAIKIRPGFKIISINTNYCYKLNWWTLYKSVDPGNILAWLTAELAIAEHDGDFVHIIGHVAPLYADCLEQWGHQFSRIVTRFAHIIKGQFYGHCHRDDVRIHYDVREPHIPIGLEYLTPNNGPFKGLNPSYRIFYVDGDHPDTTREVLDYDTFFMNLTAANAHGDASWHHLYSARRDLGMASLRPHEWDRFAREISKKPYLANKFYSYHVQASDPLLHHGCDEACQHSLVCNMVEGDKFMPSKCQH